MNEDKKQENQAEVPTSSHLDGFLEEESASQHVTTATVKWNDQNSQLTHVYRIIYNLEKVLVFPVYRRTMPLIVLVIHLIMFLIVWKRKIENQATDTDSNGERHYRADVCDYLKQKCRPRVQTSRFVSIDEPVRNASD